MKLSEADTYRLRSLAAESALARIQAQHAAQELASAFTALGLDSTKHGVVSREGVEHPLGTVIDLATGQPLQRLEEAHYASRGPKVKEVPQGEPRLSRPELSAAVDTSQAKPRPALPDMPLAATGETKPPKPNPRFLVSCKYCTNGDIIDAQTGEREDCWACDGLGNAKPDSQ